MKNVRKTNRRKRGKGVTKKLGGTTMRKIRRPTKTVPKAQTLPVAKLPSESVVKRLHVPCAPCQSVVLGKIYSDQCIHCQNMADAWEEMKQNLPDSYTVWDIESKDEETKKKDFQNQHGVQLQSAGYPTIFMIVQGKQVDYNGDRDKDKLLQWARQTQ